jgi:hypothetical protein
MRQNVTVATGKPYFIAITLALVCFLERTIKATLAHDGFLLLPRYLISAPT